MREEFFQRRVELFEFEFVNVVRIGTLQPSRIRVIQPVRRGDQK